MNNLAELVTIVVPVRDRQYNLHKIVNYYEDFHCRKKIYDTSVAAYTGDTGDFEYVYAGPQFQYVAFHTA